MTINIKQFIDRIVWAGLAVAFFALVLLLRHGPVSHHTIVVSLLGWDGTYVFYLLAIAAYKLGTRAGTRAGGG